MTYLKAALFGSAIALTASSAAFAGDKNVMTETSADSATWTDTSTHAMDKSMKAKKNWDLKTPAEKAAYKEMKAQKAMMATQPAMDSETVGEILQFDGAPQPSGDNDIVTYDGGLIEEDVALSMEADNTLKNNAIVVPSSTGAITTVSCPAGTVAMPDMTCHIKNADAFSDAEFTVTTSMEAPSEVAGAVDYSGETTTFDNKYNPDKAYLGTLRPDSIK